MPKREKMRPLRLLAAAFLAALGVAGPALSGAVAAPSTAELQTAKDRLMELVSDQEIVIEESNLVHERLEDIQKDIAATELVVDSLERRMSGRQEDAISLAQEMYKSGPTGGMEAVLSAQSLAEMDARLAYIQSSEEANTELFERLAADRSILEAKLDDLEVSRTAAAEAEARLGELRDDIEAKITDQQDEIDELSAAIERAERRQDAREAAAEEAAAQALLEDAAEEIDASTPPPVSAPAPSAGAQAAVDAALSQVGKPYVWGAAGPNSYDCSGLTMWAWAHAGVSMPHNSGMQYAATPRVAQSDWQPGDLLFFGSPIHHVAMYIGGGRMVEAPYSGASVRVNSAYRSDYAGAGRP
jgi:peptidoglycan DL-endopeptidase CwlO